MLQVAPVALLVLAASFAFSFSRRLQLHYAAAAPLSSLHSWLLPAAASTCLTATPMSHPAMCHLVVVCVVAAKIYAAFACKMCVAYMCVCVLGVCTLCVGCAVVFNGVKSAARKTVMKHLNKLLWGFWCTIFNIAANWTRPTAVAEAEAEAEMEPGEAEAAGNGNDEGFQPCSTRRCHCWCKSTHTHTYIHAATHTQPHA